MVCTKVILSKQVLKVYMNLLAKTFEKFEEFFEIVKSLDSDSINVVNEAFLLYRSNRFIKMSISPIEETKNEP